LSAKKCGCHDAGGCQSPSEQQTRSEQERPWACPICPFTLPGPTTRDCPSTTNQPEPATCDPSPAPAVSDSGCWTCTRLRPSPPPPPTLVLHNLTSHTPSTINHHTLTNLRQPSHYTLNYTSHTHRPKLTSRIHHQLPPD